jgi:Tfp pilus assembly protein PilO
LTVTIILGGLAVLYNIVLEPLVANWKMLNIKVTAKASELKKNLRLVKMYEFIEAEYAKYSEFIEAGKNEEEELASVLAEIESVSKKTSCRIRNVKPRATRKLGNYREISFTVTAVGGIDKLSQFLYGIELSKKLLRVRHFAITPKSGSRSAGELRATFLITKIIVG